MENAIYTITLADGTVLENLRLNGNNFISAAQLTQDVFQDNLSPVIISNGETEERHENMALVHLTAYKGERWFTIRDLSPEELWKLKMEANMEYIAMMGDVEL